MRSSLPSLAAAAAAAQLAVSSPALALPTMVRLGYGDCASCHYAPQGGGPLTAYGRSVDEAQSLRAGEYRPREGRMVDALSWRGRITQDLRVLLPVQRTSSAQTTDTSFRARLMYRNVTQLPFNLAAHATIVTASEPAPRLARSYDPGAHASAPLVAVALLRSRLSPSLELTGGRDQLPTGIFVPDRALFTKSLNRLGEYDAPTQIALHWSGERHRVTPFAYGPGGTEAQLDRESGGGAVAEVDLLGQHRTIVGMTVLRGSAGRGDRRSGGIYMRLGFGAWGVLAEHDITDRTIASSGMSFRQHASHAQVFWAAREWLVASAVGERLSVRAPLQERLTAGKAEITARLTSTATVGASARVQRDSTSGRLSSTLMIQAALKTVY